MLRFHKFTIGHAWTTDYGSADNEADFGYLHPYSPLHNVRGPTSGTKQYPAVILATGAWGMWWRLFWRLYGCGAPYGGCPGVTKTA